MMKSKHDLANVTISILVDFDKKSRFSISILRSSQHYCRCGMIRVKFSLILGAASSISDHTDCILFAIIDKLKCRKVVLRSRNFWFCST